MTLALKSPLNVMLLALATAAAGPASAVDANPRQPPVWPGLEAGPHPVGFEAFVTVDPTRPYWPGSVGEGDDRRGAGGTRATP